MNIRFSAAAAAVVVLCAVPSVAHAASKTPTTDGHKVKVTTSLGYNTSSGKYGQPTSTRITYMPASAKLSYESWAFKVTVPYVRVRGPGVVVGDVPVGVPGAVSTQSGFGDMLTSASYTHQIRPDTTMDMTGILKLPTADKGKKLGTGLTDFTLQAGAAHQIGEGYINGNIGRRFNGSNNTFPVRDVWKTSLGGGYKVMPETTVGAAYDYKQRMTATSKSFNQLTAYVNQDITDDWSGQIYGAKGLSDGAPDTSVGVQVGYKFNLFGG